MGLGSQVALFEGKAFQKLPAVSQFLQPFSFQIAYCLNGVSWFP